VNISFDFSSRVALVVGGSKGIGQRVCIDLLNSGAKVFYVSRNRSQDLDSLGAKHLKCDLRNELAIKSCFDKLPSLDFLINCAAINHCKKIEKISSQEWDDVLAVNLRAYFITCKEAVEKMKKANFGRIVNVSSIAGRHRSLVSGTHYVASKSAIIGLTRQLAYECAGDNITVNVVCPSQTMTPMLKESMTSEQIEQLCTAIPLKRIAETQDQSLPILFLCSDGANYITGAAIDINGGQY
tara:strand:- start:377 stop:1096 length:720 start_codon:yes stop_codon:yes gene_type:complete